MDHYEDKRSGIPGHLIFQQDLLRGISIFKERSAEAISEGIPNSEAVTARDVFTELA